MKAVGYEEKLAVSSIRQSPFHFRKETATQKLDDLAASIKELGLIHAISVVRDPAGGYELVNGHRRLLAHKRAKMPEIRASVYEYDAEELEDERKRQQAVVQFLLAANSQEPLMPYERGRYYAEAIEKFGWEPEDIARVHHLSVEKVIDDLMFLNLEERVLELVQAHPESFTQENLKVLAEYSTPSKSKAWTMTQDEQVEVAEEIAHQRDKRLVDSTRYLRTHIVDKVKQRRAETAKARRKLGGGSDAVKGLFKLVESVRKSVEELKKADLSGIKEMDARDKGAVYQNVFACAQELMDFAEGPVQQLKTKGAAKAKAVPEAV